MGITRLGLEGKPTKPHIIACHVHKIKNPSRPSTTHKIDLTLPVITQAVTIIAATN